MARRGMHAWSCVLAAALGSSGCEAKTRGAAEEDPSPAPETEPLDLAVDRVDIAHGALRVSATMRDGSADVRVTLGNECNGRDVGGGMATPSSFVWMFGEDDLAGALGCDLEVVARAKTPTGYVLRTASLAVSAEVVPPSSGERTPLPSTSRSTTDGELAFAPGSAEERWSVPLRDFARAVLSSRPLRVGSTSFDPSVCIGGIELETEQTDVTLAE